MSNQNLIGPTPIELIQEAIQLRDNKKKAETEIALFLDTKYNSRLKDIESELLQILNDLEADNIKTAAGTAFKRTETSVTVADASVFKRHVVGTESWDLIDFRANKTAVKEFVEENDGHLPPGVNMSQFTAVSIRKPTAKD